jgi:hypothetical protein
MIPNGRLGQHFQQQVIDVDGLDMWQLKWNSWGYSGFRVQRSESACFAQQKGTSSCYNSVAIFLISLSDKNFEFSNFQIPLPLAWRVSGRIESGEEDFFHDPTGMILRGSGRAINVFVLRHDLTMRLRESHNVPPGSKIFCVKYLIVTYRSLRYVHPRRFIIRIPVGSLSP